MKRYCILIAVLISQAAFAVDLTSPPDGSFVESTTVTLQWDLWGAFIPPLLSGYKVSVYKWGTEEIFSKIIPAGYVGSTEVTGLEFDVTYTWNVIWYVALPYVQETNPETWSFYVKRQAGPVLVSPANCSTVINSTTQLSWQPVSGASWYLVHASTNVQFSSVVVNTWTNETQINIPGLAAGTIYYWRVSACMGGTVFTSWSYRTFIFQPPPSLITPDGSVFNHSPVLLAWNGVPGASRYQVTVSKYKDLSLKEVRSCITGATQTTMAGLTSDYMNGGTRYAWSVRADNSYGWGQFSPSRSFTLLLAPTSKFALSIDKSGSGEGQVKVNNVLKSLPYAITEVQGTFELEAIPASGSLFAGWSGDVTGTLARTSLTMNSDKYLIAAFLKNQAAVYPAPTNLAALVGYDHAVPLAWKAPYSIPSGTALQGYNITRQQVRNNIFGPWIRIASNVSKTYYRDESVIKDDTYYYIVTAVYNTGESAFSVAAQSQTRTNGYIIQSAAAGKVPNINGSIGSGEWQGAGTADILYPGDTGVVTFYALNDAGALYVAVDDQRDAALHANDTFGLFFDENRDREWPVSAPSGEGLLQLFWNGSSAVNAYQGLHGTWPADVRGETTAAGTGVTQAVSASSGRVQYEGRIPFSAFLQTGAGSTVGMFLYVYEGQSGSFDGVWPQEAMRALPLYTSGYAWAHGPFSYGDLVLANSQSQAVEAPFRGTVPDGAGTGTEFRLYANYPNPFNPRTTIRFGVKEPCRVVLRIYDLQGREVSQPADAEYPPGEFEAPFDASGLASGIYFYRIEMGNFSAVRKMVLVE